MEKIKYSKHKGVALIYVIMVVAMMSIVGTMALMMSDKENKSALAEQRNTKSYYAARSGAAAVDNLIRNSGNQ